MNTSLDISTFRNNGSIHLSHYLLFTWCGLPIMMMEAEEKARKAEPAPAPVSTQPHHTKWMKELEPERESRRKGEAWRGKSGPFLSFFLFLCSLWQVEWSGVEKVKEKACFLRYSFFTPFFLSNPSLSRLLDMLTWHSFQQAHPLSLFYKPLLYTFMADDADGSSESKAWVGSIRQNLFGGMRKEGKVRISVTQTCLSLLS